MSIDYVMRDAMICADSSNPLSSQEKPMTNPLSLVLGSLLCSASLLSAADLQGVRPQQRAKHARTRVRHWLPLAAQRVA